MPELPEVERARKLVEETCVGFEIASVDSREDKIVYTGGITHEDYVKELEGRTITGCSRKGKIFWLDLSGTGRLPVMHFGMTGMIMLKGREPDWYMRKPRKVDRLKDDWPPVKYVKFILKLEPAEGSVGKEPVELAFLDSRRLARLRLLPQPPLSHPPLSVLGFDPYLSHPTLPEFLALLDKRPRATIKGVIMDQSFSAGVGNWVADEILYQARVHPACPVGKMSDEMKEGIWREMKVVVDTAVEANANHAKFPKDWLFSWRWSKGKKDKNRKDKDESGGFRLPDGRPATLAFITVGGRTSAYVEELQTLPEGVVYKPPKKKATKAESEASSSSSSDAESELTEPSFENGEVEEKPKPAVKTVAPVKQAGKGARSVKAKKGKVEKVEEVVYEVKEEEEQAKPATKRKAADGAKSAPTNGVKRQKRATNSKKVKRESSSELSEEDEASVRQQDPSVKVEATTKEEQEGEVDSGRRKSRRGKTTR
ncbi:Formamidopyrimidine-DNA glycosylase N-terminal domain-containing protein [Filobasidium floriforme]|uniref:Formamidopyrimidine-DNA glycosylase N-terminal domain-containing protein n=1 Tax=Filobasidium floriforme TaxID=5210 RepID=UPI001E8D71E5|nr:Formamidopyrimidine-DNA glycosylase N-terminal domain-containing protein [Filobasidium floriforme]KAH8083725.1 Formamidopyrimidine-DNA glycosylase N-terminal domain-containing protein [Filobasidium floriforme]